jgi:hypothetical protein
MPIEPSTGHLSRNGQAKPRRMPSPPIMWCTRCLIVLSVRRTSCKPRALENPREASSFLAISRTISGAFVHKRARSYRGNASPAPIVDSTTRHVTDVSIWELCADRALVFRPAVAAFEISVRDKYLEHKITRWLVTKIRRRGTRRQFAQWRNLQWMNPLSR